MKPRHVRSLVLASSIVALVIGAGCQSAGHRMEAPPNGSTYVCNECYTAALAAQHDERGGGAKPDGVLRAFVCPCCKTDMAVYRENGLLKVRCGNCAPNGLLASKCALRPEED